MLAIRLDHEGQEVIEFEAPRRPQLAEEARRQRRRVRRGQPAIA
jgi:hypothetical protein